MNTRRFVTLAALLVPSIAAAQDHKHEPGMTHPGATPQLQQPGQAVFGAIGEIVRILMADSSTDWSKVDIEGLRRHLIDMDDVTMRSTVAQEAVPGGARFTVTGEGRVVGAIRRMTKSHSQMVNAEGEQRITVDEVPGGARLTVVASQAGDARAEARIRGLGFIGFMTLGDHHGPHHLAMARGQTPAAHQHE